MTIRSLGTTIALVLALALPARASDPVAVACELETSGEDSESGDRWSAQARSRDLDPETLEGKGRVFHHLGDGREFSGKVELIRCRRNGGILADVIGTGRFRGRHCGLEECTPDREQFEFRLTGRDDIDADFYSFRILDENGLDLYASGAVLPDGGVVVTEIR